MGVGLETELIDDERLVRVEALVEGVTVVKSSDNVGARTPLMDAMNDEDNDL
jgi:hypothetical protein